jgi:branched-chain amino acid transport system ATP-binding protein
MAPPPPLLDLGLVMTILQAEGVTKRFGGLVAVDDVSLNIQKGKIFGLIGPNGAGKTTLLNVIAGVYKPDGGTVRLNGSKIVGLTPERICRKGIARTFQISRPFLKMSALESVMVGAVFGSPVRRKDAQAWAEEVLAFVEFSMPKNTLAGNLNTAQLKRLDLARALASDPEVLLVDEMAAGLTPTKLVEAMSIVRKIRERGITVLMVEHVMQVIMGLCDRIAVLDHGHKIAEGTPAEIQEDQRVIDAYLGAGDLHQGGEAIA